MSMSMPASTATATVTATATATIDLERRLSVLEAQVGIVSRNNANPNKDEETHVGDRLAKLRVDLERKIVESSSSSSSSSAGGAGAGNITERTTTTAVVPQISREYQECQRLLQELDPGIALTHQQQPLLYKRQQVLASSDELTRDFLQLDIILKLLLSGTRVDVSSLHSSGGDFTVAAAAAAGKNKSSSGGGGGAATTTDANTTTTTTTKTGQSSSSSSSAAEKQQQDQEQQRRNNNPHQQQHNLLRLDQVTQAPILTLSNNTNTTTNTAIITPNDQQRMEDLRLKLLNLNDRTTSLSQTLRHYLECYHTAMTAVSEKIVLADEARIRTNCTDRIG